MTHCYACELTESEILILVAAGVSWCVQVQMFLHHCQQPIDWKESVGFHCQIERARVVPWREKKYYSSKTRAATSQRAALAYIEEKWAGLGCIMSPLATGSHFSPSVSLDVPTLHGAMTKPSQNPSARPPPATEDATTEATDDGRRFRQN
jgi:hypothetical protein